MKKIIYLFLVFVLLLSGCIYEADISEGSIIETGSFYASEDITSDLSDEEYISETNSQNTSEESEDSFEITPEHGWVINEYGYTYVYNGSGYQQFNYKKTSMERYIKNITAVADTVPKNTRIFNIVAPVSSTFANIPREIYIEDNFYNLSQSAFVSTTSAALPERIINIPIITDIEKLYRSGENIFYRTDRNWTPFAAYYAYTAYCKAAGITPYGIEKFPESEGFDFLGSFYKATKSKSMEADPDEMIVRFPPDECGNVLTVYDNGIVYKNYGVCVNTATLYSGYDVFLGRDAERYEINTTSDGGNLLVIADSSIDAMVPFLIPHYNKIDIIRPEKFKSNLKDHLSAREYDDILIICYSTNAVSGDFIPALYEITGVLS